MSAATAAWPTRDLVGALGRAGWGPLDGRPMGGARSVLRALVDLLPYGSGAGHVTVAQVADVAGLSTKWTRRCLRVLADLGIITHQVGHVAAGRPQPGHVRISKRALCQIIRHATGRLQERRRARKDETRARLDQAGIVTWWPKRRNPKPFHMELSSTLPTQGEVPGHRGAHPTADTRREDLPMPTPCIHDLPDVNRCALCRRQLAENPTMDPRELHRQTPAGPAVTPRGGWRALVAAADDQARRTAVGTDEGQAALL